MSTAARKLASFEELYAEIAALPENMTGEILEPGAVRTTPRPGKGHRRAALRMLRALDGFNETMGGAGWWLEVEAEILLAGGFLVVPDLSGWRVERVTELPDENPIAIVPDFCAEVLSGSTARTDKVVKLPLYARSGVRWVWLIDPALRVVEVYETIEGKPTWITSAQDEDRGALPPFDGEIDVGPWWPPHRGT